MLSAEQIERYRAMTPGERLEITFALMRESTPWLLVGTPEQVDRKFELIRRENDWRNRNMLEAFARTGPAAHVNVQRVADRELRQVGLELRRVDGLKYLLLVHVGSPGSEVRGQSSEVRSQKSEMRRRV